MHNTSIIDPFLKERIFLWFNSISLFSKNCKISRHFNVLRSFAFFLGVGGRFDSVIYFIVNLLTLFRRLAASEKSVRDAQKKIEGDFEIVKLLLYYNKKMAFVSRAGFGKLFAA